MNTVGLNWRRFVRQSSCHISDEVASDCQRNLAQKIGYLQYMYKAATLLPNVHCDVIENHWQSIEFMSSICIGWMRTNHDRIKLAFVEPGVTSVPQPLDRAMMSFEGGSSKASGITVGHRDPQHIG
eukprot:5138299-Amphidinium_carterae.1